jgi:LysM repeat protein
LIIQQYDGRLFGYASMNFYSEFVAAVEVYENYQQYFGELVLDTPSTKTPAAKAPVQLASAKSPSSKYKVRSGDSLSRIAQRFRTSIAELMERNNLSNSVIHAGQILLVK